jgi:A/G-specific adenine glycosylase
LPVQLSKPFTRGSDTRKQKIEQFKKTILDFYKQSGRSFPWRYTGKANPWGVLVSEFMLQQTQTSRVVPY